MRVIPQQVSPATRSPAEKRLFEVLRHVDFPGNAVVLHSINLSEHQYKLCGELDFLVVCEEGLFVIEVKGGGVTRADGVWLYTDRFGVAHRSFEGPFEQARSGMFSLKSGLEQQLGRDEMSGIVFGHAVAFPDCRFEVTSVEWDPRMVLDHRTCNDASRLAGALADLMRYWRSKTPRDRLISYEERSRIIECVRPNFDRVPSLMVRADQIDARQEDLTREQYGTLDSIEDNERILCLGGAGTGKTFLALEAARRHSSQDQSVLLVCSGSCLESFIRSRLGADGVRVVTLDQLHGITEPRDVLIVDEGQDLMTMEALTQLDSVVSGGLKDGTWRIFLDPNAQSNLLGRFDPEALEFLKSYHPVLTKLTKNCRNTHEIVIQTKLLTGADMGGASVGHGPRVIIEWAANPGDAANALEARVRHLEKTEVAPGEVTYVWDPVPWTQC